MELSIQALNLFNKPISGVDGVSERFGSMRTRKIAGTEGATSPYQAIASTNCELTPDVSGGGYTHGIGAYSSQKNWMF